MIDCAATKVHIDLTGGWKSALLFYLCAKEISDSGAEGTSIVPCVTKRINRYNVEGMNRPDAITIVTQQIEWIKDKFPNVTIDPLLSIDVDFWWISITSINRRPVDLSEKVLLRHTYELCTNKKLYPAIDVLPDIPIIKSYNAYCEDLDITDNDEKNPYYRKRRFDHGETTNTVYGDSVSLCNGDVIAFQPFAKSTKTNLVGIAKSLNIINDLNTVTYTCEQDTSEPLDDCEQCFNCLQMKRATANND
jgi:hypothetical protein